MALKRSGSAERGDRSALNRAIDEKTVAACRGSPESESAANVQSETRVGAIVTSVCATGGGGVSFGQPLNLRPGLGLGLGLGLGFEAKLRVRVRVRVRGQDSRAGLVFEARTLVFEAKLRVKGVGLGFEAKTLGLG